MKIDHQKMHDLMGRESTSLSPDELRREANVFFVGGNLPERQTLETIFESHYQSNAALFHLTFGDVDSFQNGEILAKMIKKNFNVHLVGRLNFAAPYHLIERAYAAGIDILDIPLTSDHVESGERRRALDCARTVFPRWSVVSTLEAGDEPADATLAQIDALLAAEVVPLVTLTDRATALSADAISKIFHHLTLSWRKHKAVIKPLTPLIYLCTPLVQSVPRGVLHGFISAIDDRRLLATSDLRRVLRVKEAEQSYASSGL
jgi:hypothetical protein